MADSALCSAPALSQVLLHPLSPSSSTSAAAWNGLLSGQSHLFIWDCSWSSNSRANEKVMNQFCQVTYVHTGTVSPFGPVNIVGESTSPEIQIAISKDSDHHKSKTTHYPIEIQRANSVPWERKLPRLQELLQKTSLKIALSIYHAPLLTAKLHYLPDMSWLSQWLPDIIHELTN